MSKSRDKLINKQFTSPSSRNPVKEKKYSVKAHNVPDRQLPVVVGTTRLPPLRPKEHGQLPFRTRKTQDGSTKPLVTPNRQDSERNQEEKPISKEKNEGKEKEKKGLQENKTLCQENKEKIDQGTSENLPSGILDLEIKGLRIGKVKKGKDDDDQVWYITDGGFAIKGTGMKINKQKKKKIKSTKEVEMDFLDRQNWPSIEESFQMEEISKKRNIPQNVPKSNKKKVIWRSNTDLQLGFRYNLRKLKYWTDPKYKQKFIAPAVQKQPKPNYKLIEKFSDFQDTMLASLRSVRKSKLKYEGVKEEAVEEEAVQNLSVLLAAKNRIMRKIHYDGIPVKQLNLEKNFKRRRRRINLKKVLRKRDAKNKKESKDSGHYSHEKVEMKQKLLKPKVTRIPNRCGDKARRLASSFCGHLKVRCVKSLTNSADSQAADGKHRPIPVSGVDRHV